MNSARRQLQAFAVELVLAVLEELASGAVEAERRSACPACSRPARSPAGSARSPLRGWRQIRREAAFVADRGGQACCRCRIFFSVWKTSAP